MLYKIRDVMRLIITVLVVFESLGIHLPLGSKEQKEESSKTVVLSLSKANRVCEPTIG